MDRQKFYKQLTGSIRHGMAHAAKFLTFRILYNGIYCIHARKPVKENKVLFVEVREAAISNSFQLLFDRIREKKAYHVHAHYLRSGFVGRLEYIRRCTAMLKDLADAKYVFLNERLL